MIKRAFDLVAAIVGLILLSPVMAVVAVLVRRHSEGPVFFRQERIGQGGRPFNLLKFRSMVSAPGASGPLLTVGGDARITRIGARLRATKIDELPQLINVVRGEMSIVGPRPEVAKYVAMWSEQDRRIILSIRPGITDPATLRLRCEEELLGQQEDPERYYEEVLLPEKAAAYVAYAQSRTLIGDLRLVVRTLIATSAGQWGRSRSFSGCTQSTGGRT